MLNNNIKILLVSFVHHIELQNFLNAPRMYYKSLSTLSQKSAIVAEFRRCLDVFGDSLTFLRQCGQALKGYRDRGFSPDSVH